MYLRLDDNAWPFSEAHIRAQTPDTSYPIPMPAAIPGFRRITPMPAPVAGTGEVAVEVAPLLDGEAWRQQWVLRAATDAELAAMAAASVPQAVTMRQARLALLGAGMLAAVNAAIAAMPGVQGEAARIEWEFSSEVKRTQPLVTALGVALSLTPDQLDNLFAAAAAL